MENKDGFDDEIMQAFISDKEVIEFAEHFFVHDKIPYLTVILSYRDMDQGRRRIFSREDPRKELDDNEKEAYEALRAWRSQRAKQEGCAASCTCISGASFSGIQDFPGCCPHQPSGMAPFSEKGTAKRGFPA